MEITAPTVAAGAAVLTGAVSLAGAIIRASFAERDVQIASAKVAQKLLFEKHDEVAKALTDYKLHVAETYVSQATLEKALAPLGAALDEIKHDIRDLRGKRGGSGA